MESLVDFSSAGSSLPWLWIIEYLANFKEVETCILQEMAEMVPDVPDDLATAAREILALRCLEDLYGYTDKVSNDGLSAAEKKIGFALSESCDDVLHRILQETSASNLKIDGPELLKWDVHPFIMHKRASMPKCALQQLKDTILEGTHPLASSLKESSGLMCVNECGTAHHVGDLDHNDQSMSEKENLLPLTSEDGDRLQGADFHNRNVFPCKRGRDCMAARDMAGQTSEVRVESDLDYNAKKLKQDAISNRQSADKILDPFCGEENVEPLSGRDVAVTRGEGSHIANESQYESAEESLLPEDDCNNCDYLGRDGQDGPVSDDQIVDSQTAEKMPPDEPVQNAIIGEANITEPRVDSVGTQQKDTVDESRGETEHSCGEEMLSHNDEYHNERIDVAMKKSHFLNSQTSVSLAMSGWTGQNLCVKCNNDGRLLSCSTSSCPLVVHEKCLGFPVKFDEKGNFHCPFCAYTLAISEYLEAKKKVSMVRKELAAFIQMGSEYHQKDLTDILHRQVPGHSRSNGDKTIRETDVGGQENNKEIPNGQSLCDFNDHQKGIANEEKAEPSASCVNANSQCRDEEANTLSGRECESNGEKVMEESIIKGPPSERGLEGQPEHVPPDPNFNSGQLTCTNTNFPRVDQTEAEGEIQKEDLQIASSDPPEKPVIALNIDGEENSEGENDKLIISNYSIRFRRRETHHTYPAIPLLRRKKVPWTAKEEEMVRKGVQKFASIEDRNIPWKKILEFGSSVFLSGRTTIDLKDKWRNMCKGSPKCK